MRFAAFVFGGLVVAASSSALAAPAAPSGAHPRIFLNAPTVAALKANMAQSGTAAAAVIAKCADVSARPGKYDDSVYQGYGWAYPAAACGMAWQLTKDPAHAAAGLRMFRALLEDYQTVGDGAGGDTAEQHDSGYSMRYFGAYAAIAYDWLHDAPDAAPLLDRARALFKTWVDWYEANGYLKDAPGSNYHAGYLFAKTMIAVAASGEDDGSAAKYWADVVDRMFGQELDAKGFRAPAPLAGGDWPEGWEYGPLGVLEYALSARALEEQGAAQPNAHAWASQLSLHYQYALTPDRKGFFPAGDLGTKDIEAAPSPEPLLAAMAGPASDEAAGWSAWLHANVVTTRDENVAVEALAEARGATAAAFASSARAPFYVTPGTRKLYARSSWDPGAFWAVVTSAPKFGVDHQHLDASNFVFSRGGDSLVADPSPYGSLSTLTGNAITVDSQTVEHNYRPSQSPYSRAELAWARATQKGVAAARAELAGAFAGEDGKSDVPFARRDWAFLPEGEVVAIDRVRTDAAERKTYLRFRSPGTFTLGAGNTATATVGASKLVVHPVVLSSGTPAVRALTGDPNSPCDGQPFGVCDAARFDAGEFAVTLDGPTALAVHVFDGLGAQESAAEAVPVTDPAIVGARVTRGAMRAFVVASSAKDGAAGSALAYKADGDRAARHVVFDAPEDDGGKSTVTARADGGSCAVSITAGGANAFAGRPLVFEIAAAADGCAVTEDVAAAPSVVPDAPGGADAGSTPSPTRADAPSSASGCACSAPGNVHPDCGAAALLAIALLFTIGRAKRSG